MPTTRPGVLFFEVRPLSHLSFGYSPCLPKLRLPAFHRRFCSLESFSARLTPVMKPSYPLSLALVCLHQSPPFFLPYPYTCSSSRIPFPAIPSGSPETSMHTLTALTFFTPPLGHFSSYDLLGGKQMSRPTFPFLFFFYSLSPRTRHPFPPDHPLAIPPLEAVILISSSSFFPRSPIPPYPHV